jgi:hypothetical protein
MDLRVSNEKLYACGGELRSVLNRYSMENTSDTPDFILAAYLLDCLEAFAKATGRREEWYGRWPKNAPMAPAQSGKESGK